MTSVWALLSFRVERGRHRPAEPSQRHSSAFAFLFGNPLTLEISLEKSSSSLLKWAAKSSRSAWWLLSGAHGRCPRGTPAFEVGPAGFPSALWCPNCILPTALPQGLRLLQATERSRRQGQRSGFLKGVPAEWEGGQEAGGPGQEECVQVTQVAPQRGAGKGGGRSLAWSAGPSGP